MELRDRLELFLAKDPSVSDAAYVAKTAELFGDVRLGVGVSVWPKCVLRADINYIEVGDGTNIQDGSIFHLSDEYPVEVGRDVTIGHGAMVHACKIEDECLIGMRATVLDGAVIGKQSIIGAGAVVPKGIQVPEGSLVLGIPGKVVKALSDEDRAGIRYWAEKYQKLAEAHRERYE